MLLGPGLSAFLFLNEDKLNLELNLSREAERLLVGGGGGNWGFEVAVVALVGIITDPGRLRNADTGRRDGV
jgi:hypothetical protein